VNPKYILFTFVLLYWSWFYIEK